MQQKEKENVLIVQEVSIRVVLDKVHAQDVHLELTQEKKDQRVLMSAFQCVDSAHTPQQDLCHVLSVPEIATQDNHLQMGLKNVSHVHQPPLPINHQHQDQNFVDPNVNLDSTQQLD